MYFSIYYTARNNLKLKKLWGLVLTALLIFVLAVPASADGASPVETDSEAYIVTDRTTGQVLIEKKRR